MVKGHLGSNSDHRPDVFVYSSKIIFVYFWVRYFQTWRNELVTGHHLSRILDSEMFPKICVYYWLNFNYVIVWYVMTYLSIISEPALYSKIYVAYEIKRRCIIIYQNLTELVKIVWFNLRKHWRNIHGEVSIHLREAEN